MSTVYFHSPDKTAALAGIERHLYGRLCSDLAIGVSDINHDFFQKERAEQWAKYLSEKGSLRGFVTSGDYRSFFHLLPQIIENGFSGDTFVYKGHGLSNFSLVLNTAICYGSNPIRLAARIHGQCEIHGWVEGRDRAWLADLFEEGLSSSIFRRTFRDKSVGYDKVIEHLRSSTEFPVVMSYSVCDSFPNRMLAKEGGWEGDPADDSFYDESTDVQWGWCMKYLRDCEAKGHGLQLRPSNFANYRFGHELTLPDLVSDRAEAMLEKWVAEKEKQS